MAIKNIVFDLGGVIMDLDRSCAVRKFEDLGIKDAEQLIDPYEQNGIFLEVENGKLDAEGFRRALSSHAGFELTSDQIRDAWLGFVTGVPLYKLDYLLELREQYKVYVLSNTNPFIMDSWALTEEFSEAHRPLSDYCEKIYASFRIGVTKPDPYIFEYMLKDEPMVPQETLFVDDGLKNVEVAQTFGMHTYHPKNKEDWREAINHILAE